MTEAVSEKHQIPVKGPDGQVIAQATVTETDDGLMTEMVLPSVPGAIEVAAGGMSFAFREPDPDLMPHDLLAPELPRIKRRDELLLGTA